jgi:protein N-terminal methyltransferase
MDENVEIADPKAVFKQHSEGWYSISTAYWSQQLANVDGMLGGYPELDAIDTLSSRELIQKYQNPPRNRSKFALGKTCVADCGCGIGRVASTILCDYFSEIDLIDPVEHFVDVAAQTLQRGCPRVRKFVGGVQNWIPDRGYDAFWIQWIIMYLTDDDAIAFLARCKANLKTNGLIFIKDNLASVDLKLERKEAQFFPRDRSICRVYTHFRELFKAAKLTLVETVRQERWPEDLLPLYTFVLQ